MARRIRLFNDSQITVELFIELIYFSFVQEILNGILERGSQFTELEYIQMLQLMNRSRPGTSSSEITRHLERLSEILGELGVTV